MFLLKQKVTIDKNQYNPCESSLSITIRRLVFTAPLLSTPKNKTPSPSSQRRLLSFCPVHLIPSGDRVLIRLAIHLILHCRSCITSPENMEMSILRKTKNLHMEGVWKGKKKKKSICKLFIVKNPPVRKKVKQQHVNHAGRYVDLEAS